MSRQRRDRMGSSSRNWHKAEPFTKFGKFRPSYRQTLANTIHRRIDIHFPLPPPPPPQTIWMTMYWHRFIRKEWNYTADILSSQFLPTQKLQQLMMRIMIIIDKFRMVSAQLLPSYSHYSSSSTAHHPGHPFLFSSSVPVDNEDESDPGLCVCAFARRLLLLPTLLAFRILSTLVLLPPTSTSSADWSRDLHILFAI